MTNEHEKDRERGITIHIDHRMYMAPTTPMTGTELRRLAEPDVGPDRDLWLTVPGPADDLLIGNDQAVELKPGMHFYTAPSTINPGGSDAAA